MRGLIRGFTIGHEQTIWIRKRFGNASLAICGGCPTRIISDVHRILGVGKCTVYRWRLLSEPPDDLAAKPYLTYVILKLALELQPVAHATVDPF